MVKAEYTISIHANEEEMEKLRRYCKTHNCKPYGLLKERIREVCQEVDKSGSVTKSKPSNGGEDAAPETGDSRQSKDVDRGSSGSTGGENLSPGEQIIIAE
jgi:hypothetical protein